jgi:hypothetical protein
MISSINSKKLIDTIARNDIENTLAKVHFGESREGDYHCSFSILILNNNIGQRIKLNPEIIYGKDGRSKANIMRIVTRHLKFIRYAYNRRLKTYPEIEGKLTVKFAIDQYGQVVFIKKLKSTLSDELLEIAVIQQIQQWRFEQIFKTGDVTEVVYPFVFSK